MFKKGQIPWNKSVTGVIKYTSKQKEEKGWGKVVECGTCSTKFYKENNQLRGKGNHFCSRNCYHKFRKGQDLGGRVLQECKECRQVYRKERYLLESSGGFCSHKCYSIYKSREGNTPFTGPTKPEKYFRSLLETLGVEFKSQKLLETEECGRCYYDFYLPKKNLLIEIDGDYWHGNPKVYKHLNKQQKQCRKRDEQKNSVAIQKGFQIIRIWEQDLNSMNEEDVKKLILK